MAQTPTNWDDRRQAPLIQRLAHLYWRFSRPMTLGVRVAVLDPARGVVLVRHGYTPGWHLPGGGVDAGETLAQAAVRELEEEAAIAVEGEPQLHGVFLNLRASRRDHVAVYVVRHFRELGPRRPDREIAAVGFHPLDALPEGTTRATRARLAEITDGRSPPGLW